MKKFVLVLALVAVVAGGSLTVFATEVTSTEEAKSTGLARACENMKDSNMMNGVGIENGMQNMREAVGCH